MLYKIDPSGTLTVLHTFSGMEDGSYPEGDLIFDAARNLYGTASSGVVFRLDQGGEFSVLFTFAGGAGGSDLESGVILDGAGNLYGTAYQGGSGDCYPRNGCGLLYRIDPSGHETVLHTFTGGPDGGSPIGGLVFDSAGNLYGTTEVGGASGRGVVFMLDAAGNETVLHDFAGPPDGSAPLAGVTLDPNGNIFGTTYEGGKQASGVVFRLSPAGAALK